MIQEDNSLRINKNNGLINKLNKKDKRINKKNIKHICMHNKLNNLTE
jgi:hypothetical protein